MPISKCEEFCGCCIHRPVCKNIDIFAGFCEKAENLEKEFPESISLKVSCKNFYNQQSASSFFRDH